MHRPGGQKERVSLDWSGAGGEVELGVGVKAEGLTDPSRMIVPSETVSPNPQPLPLPTTAGRVLLLLWTSEPLTVRDRANQSRDSNHP